MPIRKNITIDRHGYAVDYPDECPICHHHSEIKMLQGRIEAENAGVQVVFQCAFTNCGSYFIGFYGPRPAPELIALRPNKPTLENIPEEIREISPDFVAIYQEAEDALHMGLTQIAGPGYRKAFEYLIKDYAKSLDPDRSDEIAAKFSGEVVSEFVVDPRISAVAKRALWLGNDETHYLRKWKNHDVSDLITLIRLCINWIEIDTLSQSYVEEMTDQDA